MYELIKSIYSGYEQELFPYNTVVIDKSCLLEPVDYSNRHENKYNYTYNFGDRFFFFITLPNELNRDNSHTIEGSIRNHIIDAWNKYFNEIGLSSQATKILSKVHTHREIINQFSDIYLDSKSNLKKKFQIVFDCSGPLFPEIAHDLTMAILKNIEIRSVNKIIIFKSTSFEKFTDQTLNMLEQFFPNRVETNVFRTNYKTPSNDVVQRISEIEFDLIKRCANNPEALFNLSPREFEILVAEIFQKHGFSVELTPETRDGGVDIIAIQDSSLTGKVVHLIECKRYSQKQKVGINYVQRLLGAVSQKNAHKGILVTTSFFTDPAKTVAKESKNILELQDYNIITKWLKQLN